MNNDDFLFGVVVDVFMSALTGSCHKDSSHRNSHSVLGVGVV